MSRIMLLGFAPLPGDNPRALSALNQRTWHLARALGEDGHRVLLAAVRAPGAYADEADLPAVLERGIEPAITYRAVRAAEFHAGTLVAQWAHEFDPEAIVAVGPRVGYVVGELGLTAPMWADLYGYLMGEAQAAAYVHDDDAHLAAWQVERATLERADALSACSRRQRYAVVGELGAVGRLGKAAAGYEFVHVMPPCVEPEPYQHTRTVIRGVLAAPDDFVLLFAGGYNTWTDVDTLFDGVQRAMRRNRHLRFVSTGGAITGHDEHTFARFREMIRGSLFADRFSFAGWVESAEVPNYYLEAEVGINVDRFNYETLLGTRYRLVDMCKAGLPVITTLGTEVSQEIRQAGLGLTFRIGDGVGLAEAILRLAGDRQERDAMAQRAGRYALEQWHYATALQPLRAWARQPQHAPDFGRAAGAPAVAAVSVMPRSRLATMAAVIETEGYAAAVGRGLRGLGRQGVRLVRTAVQAVTVLGARAMLVRRRSAMESIAAAQPQRVLVIAPADAEQTRRALERLREALPDAEVTALAPESVHPVLRRQPGVRIMGAVAGGGVRALYAQAGRVRGHGFEVAVVTDANARREGLLAWLSGARVYVLDRGGALEVVFDPAAALGIGARRTLALAQRLLCQALLGLVLIASAVVNLVGRLRRASPPER